MRIRSNWNVEHDENETAIQQQSPTSMRKRTAMTARQHTQENKKPRDTNELHNIHSNQHVPIQRNPKFREYKKTTD